MRGEVIKKPLKMSRLLLGLFYGALLPFQFYASGQSYIRHEEPYTVSQVSSHKLGDNTFAGSFPVDRSPAQDQHLPQDYDNDVSSKQNWLTFLNPLSSQTQVHHGLLSNIADRINTDLSFVKQRQNILSKFTENVCSNSHNCQKVPEINEDDDVYKLFYNLGFGENSNELVGIDKLFGVMNAFKNAVEKLTLRQNVLYEYVTCSCNDKKECSNNLKPVLDAMFSNNAYISGELANSLISGSKNSTASYFLHYLANLFNKLPSLSGWAGGNLNFFNPLSSIFGAHLFGGALHNILKPITSKPSGGFWPNIMGSLKPEPSLGTVHKPISTSNHQGGLGGSGSLGGGTSFAGNLGGSGLGGGFSYGGVNGVGSGIGGLGGGYGYGGIGNLGGIGGLGGGGSFGGIGSLGSLGLGGGIGLGAGGLGSLGLGGGIGFGGNSGQGTSGLGTGINLAGTGSNLGGYGNFGGIGGIGGIGSTGGYTGLGGSTAGYSGVGGSGIGGLGGSNSLGAGAALGGLGGLGGFGGVGGLGGGSSVGGLGGSGFLGGIGGLGGSSSFGGLGSAGALGGAGGYVGGNHFGGISHLGGSLGGGAGVGGGVGGLLGGLGGGVGLGGGAGLGGGVGFGGGAGLGGNFGLGGSTSTQTLSGTSNSVNGSSVGITFSNPAGSEPGLGSITSAESVSGSNVLTTSGENRGKATSGGEAAQVSYSIGRSVDKSVPVSSSTPNRSRVTRQVIHPLNIAAQIEQIAANNAALVAGLGLPLFPPALATAPYYALASVLQSLG